MKTYYKYQNIIHFSISLITIMFTINQCYAVNPCNTPDTYSVWAYEYNTSNVLAKSELNESLEVEAYWIEELKVEFDIAAYEYDPDTETWGLWDLRDWVSCDELGSTWTTSDSSLCQIDEYIDPHWIVATIFWFGTFTVTGTHLGFINCTGTCGSAVSGDSTPINSITENTAEKYNETIKIWAFSKNTIPSIFHPYTQDEVLFGHAWFKLELANYSDSTNFIGANYGWYPENDEGIFGSDGELRIDSYSPDGWAGFDVDIDTMKECVDYLLAISEYDPSDPNTSYSVFINNCVHISYNVLHFAKGDLPPISNFHFELWGNTAPSPSQWAPYLNTIQ